MLIESDRLMPLTITLLFAGPLIYFIGNVIYNLFFHPLRSYPGPILWRATLLTWNYHMYTGRLTQTIAALHTQYGPVIRTSPNDLSYATAQAWEDIYAHHPGKQEFPKGPQRVQKPPNGIPNILGAEKANHARYRRLLSHAFSEKGMREQEGLIKKYVDLFIDRLGEVAKAGQPTEMVQWYNMITFDIIGDLSWGEPFNCLKDRKMHEWIPAVLGQLKFVMLSNLVRDYGLDFLIPYFVPKDVQESRRTNYGYAQQKVEDRAQLGAARGDFWDRILIKSADDNVGGEGMSKGEMLNNASVLVIGGSETISTTLSGATYLLLTHPRILKKLVDEVRTSFKTDDEIDFLSVRKLPYQLAVLEETMRFYPPVPFVFPRVPPKGGAMVCGQWIPEGTTVFVSAQALHRSPQYFTRSADFVPERWLDEAPAEFKNDNKGAFQPFGMGTRNCIGRNLAYAEMRLILAKMLWHYDFELAERTGDWFDQMEWGLWHKNPLMVKLKVANR